MNEDKENIVAVGNQNGFVIKADIERLFAGDSYGLFVFKKTEKIVTAIYLLSGLMSDKEPIKLKLRESAIMLLTTALSMSERVWGEDMFQKNLTSDICEVSAIFNLAERVKMISKMNHDIIVAELKKLSDFLINSSSNYSSAKIAFDQQKMFDGNYNFEPDQKINSILSGEFFGKTEDQINQKDIKDNAKDSVLNKMSETKIRNSETIQKDKTNRQEIILSMLKSGVKLSVKDFAQNLKDISEKTIQRELLTLVEKGVLKKEGERRWSKYFLA